ncbi:MAG TPA: hypothetical protein DEA45_03110 [Acholeplasmataceae bacterium]|nr:hypothetical protein [Acholeplasmataceae bacterium]
MNQAGLIDKGDLMKKIDLWRITTTKKGFIQALIIAIIGVFVLGFCFVRLTYFGLNLELKSDYLFAYGYGKYRLSFSYIVLIFLILYLVSLVLVLRQKDINVAYTGMMLFVILLFTGIGGFVVSIKEYRSLASYTNNIDNYGLFDQVVDDDSIRWRKLLPLKETILSYEYTFYTLFFNLWVSRGTINLYVYFI